MFDLTGAYDGRKGLDEEVFRGPREIVESAACYGLEIRRSFFFCLSLLDKDRMSQKVEEGFGVLTSLPALSSLPLPSSRTKSNGPCPVLC